MYAFRLHPYRQQSRQTKQENNGKARVAGVHRGLKCLRGNERPRKLMRQGNGCDTEGTEREVR